MKKHTALLLFALLAGAGVFAWLWSRRKVHVTATVTSPEDEIVIARPGSSGAPEVVYVD